VSCPSLSPELLESELFGHVRGAFTGAVRDAPGKVAAAEGGTLFLDEIGDLPVSLQPKLLRFLQEKEFERVGDVVTRTSDVRIISATHRDLDDLVAQGLFRQDLFFRLNVVEITPPPLRERTDLLDVARRMLDFVGRQLSRSFVGFTPEAQAALKEYSWPGNLRELRNAVERAAILSHGPAIGLADLPERIAFRAAKDSAPIEVGSRATIEQLQVEHIRKVLARSPSLEAAASILGIDPSTLFRKRRKYGL
jgi:NtrC-family two-component system response regulator AlgB